MAESESVKAVLSNGIPLLNVTFGDEHLVEAGAYHTRQTASIEPKISFPSAKPGKKYIVINIDLDAPFPSLPFLSPILHWIRHGLTINEVGDLASEIPPLTQWIAPRPPPGSGPHRYVFCLYEEPEDFSPKSFLSEGEMTRWMRMRFDFRAFEERSRVGGVIAGTWFLSD
jgi:phosphatidylethanolamine-binding protein (PEBP) family uncharacterized protein